jgi:hypothetical protein
MVSSASIHPCSLRSNRPTFGQTVSHTPNLPRFILRAMTTSSCRGV